MTNQFLVSLKESYPDLFKKLEVCAKKRLSKKDLSGPGCNLTLRFKMGSLLPGFLQKNKIKL